MVGGKQRRIRRLLGEDGKTFLVAVDHSVTTGGAGGLSDVGSIMRAVVRGGADAIVAHRGSAAHEMPAQRKTALIVHLSGNTRLSAGSELKTRVCEPESAAALGADAVSAHLTLGGGHREDRAALADLGQIARSCDRLGLPLLVMTYVMSDAEDPGPAVVHAARVAAELGADIVKAANPGNEYLADLVTDIAVPVVIAGGQADGTWEGFVDDARKAMSTGLAGLCVGRWVFGSEDPAKAAAQLAAIVHAKDRVHATAGI